MTRRRYYAEPSPFPRYLEETEETEEQARILIRRRKAVDYLNRNPEQREKQRVRARAAMKRKRDADPGYQARIRFYEELVAWQGSETCLICGVGPTRRRLSVDHDHATDEIRGLLCDPCNRLLGAAKDNVDILQSAIAYLSRPAFTGRKYADFASIKTSVYPKRRNAA